MKTMTSPRAEMTTLKVANYREKVVMLSVAKKKEIARTKEMLFLLCPLFCAIILYLCHSLDVLWLFW